MNDRKSKHKRLPKRLPKTIPGDVIYAALAFPPNGEKPELVAGRTAVEVVDYFDQKEQPIEMGVYALLETQVHARKTVRIK